MEEECEKFLKDFTENACLRKPPMDSGAHPKQGFLQALSWWEGCVGVHPLCPAGEPFLAFLWVSQVSRERGGV